jgi:hypothetical protein
LRTDPLIQRAAELWDGGDTFPAIAEALHIDREAIRVALESRHAEPPAGEVALLVAEVEAFLARQAEHKEPNL